MAGRQVHRRAPRHTRRVRTYTQGEITRNRIIIGGIYAGAGYAFVKSPRGKRMIAGAKRLVNRGVRFAGHVKRKGITKAVTSRGRYKRMMNTNILGKKAGFTYPLRKLSARAAYPKRGDKMYTKGYRTWTASPTTVKGKKRIASTMRRYGRKKGFTKVRLRQGKPIPVHFHKH